MTRTTRSAVGLVFVAAIVVTGYMALAEGGRWWGVLAGTVFAALVFASTENP